MDFVIVGYWRDNLVHIEISVSAFSDFFYHSYCVIISLGSHTGSNIYSQYEEIMRMYEVSPEQISYVVTDNASNMRAAFAVRLVAPTTDEPEPENESDYLWQDCQDSSVSSIEAVRISCFLHSLQLTVGDGLKESKAVSGALSRAVAVSNTLHRSTSYKVCVWGNYS